MGLFHFTPLSVLFTLPEDQKSSRRQKTEVTSFVFFSIDQDEICCDVEAVQVKCQDITSEQKIVFVKGHTCCFNDCIQKHALACICTVMNRFHQMRDDDSLHRTLHIDTGLYDHDHSRPNNGPVKAKLHCKWSWEFPVSLHKIWYALWLCWLLPRAHFVSQVKVQGSTLLRWYLVKLLCLWCLGTNFSVTWRNDKQGRIL